MNMKHKCPHCGRPLKPVFRENYVQCPTTIPYWECTNGHGFTAYSEIVQFLSQNIIFSNSTPEIVRRALRECRGD